MADAKVSVVLEAIDNASPALAAFKKNIQQTTSGIPASLAGAATAFAAFGVAAASGAIQATRAYADFADDIGKSASEVGVSVEGLSKLRFAGILSGDADLATIKTGFSQLSKAMVEAEKPTSGAAAAFDYLGVSMTDSSGKAKTSEALFQDLSDSFKKLPDGADKSAVAMELFGKSGTKLIPLLNNGSEGLKELGAEAEALGLVLDQQATDKAAEFSDTLDRLSLVGQGLGAQIGQALMPALQDLGTGLLESTKEGGFLKEVLAGIGSVATGAFKVLATGGAIISGVFQALGKTLGGVAAAAVLLFQGEFKQAGNVIKELHGDVVDLTVSKAEYISSLFAERAATSTTIAVTENATTTTKKYTGAKKEQKAAVDKVGEAYTSYLADLQRESDTIGLITRQQQVRYETESGKFAGRSAAQKEALINLAKEIDQRNAAVDAADKATAAIDNLNKIGSDSTMNVAEAAISMRLALQGVSVDMIEATKGSYRETAKLTEQLQSLQAAKDKAISAGDTASADLYQTKIEELDRAISDVGNTIEKNNASMYTMNRQMDIYKSTVGAVRDENRKWSDTLDALNGWLKDGTITTAEYDAALQKLIQNNPDLAKQKGLISELDEFVKQAARSMQSSMSDFFFNFMQGNLSSLTADFKRTIDRIVADMLAAQAAVALFGDYGKTGKVGGLAGAAGAVLGDIFRADGGPISAGSPYIVGERGPELIIPNASGMVIPNHVASGLSGSQMVNINITAMDSQSVLGALDKVKREAAQLFNGTNRTYNLRG